MTALEKLVVIPVLAELFTILFHLESHEARQVRRATSIVANAKNSSLQRSMYSEKKCQFVYASLLGGDKPSEETNRFCRFPCANHFASVFSLRSSDCCFAFITLFADQDR